MMREGPGVGYRAGSSSAVGVRGDPASGELERPTLHRSRAFGILAVFTVAVSSLAVGLTVGYVIGDEGIAVGLLVGAIGLGLVAWLIDYLVQRLVP